MAHPIIGKLTEEVAIFKQNCGLTGPGSSPSLRLDMDAQNYLAFHIEGNLRVLSNLETLDNNNQDQFNMLANVGDFILKLRNKIKQDNELDNNHPLCQHLTQTAALITQFKIELNPAFHTAHSIKTLELELKALKDKIDPKYYGGLNNLLQQVHLLSQKQNTSSEEILASMMQQVVKTYYDIRSPSPTLFKSSATVNPLGPVLQSFINQEMSDMGKEHAFTVPQVKPVIARGETVPSIQLPAPEQKRTATFPS